jgi:predicted Zn-dependent protease
VPESYHIRMFRKTLALLLSASAACAFGQDLPDLGASVGGPLSPQVERRIGESIMRDIRFRDPSFVDDPEVSDYLYVLGNRLVSASPDARGDFEFYAIRDPAINAFALPGGFVIVNTGLLLASQNESELASVLAHEIAHVTQRHISRLLGAQQQVQKLQLPAMVAIVAAGMLTGRADLVAGAAAAVQAGGIQAQINYTRDFEREADRIGFQTLVAADFDPAAMPAFFEKMQRSTRVSDDGSVPSYLRTHPVTTERIADAENRAARLPYRQHLDTLEFHFVRAKLRAESGHAQDAVDHFAAAVKDGRYANEAAARYGLAAALARAERFREAAEEVARLRALRVSSPMLETLDARVRQARGDAAGGLAILKEAAKRFPQRRTLAYAYATALVEAKRYQEAADFLAERLRVFPRDDRLLELHARTYAALGKNLLQHQTQAEVYVQRGSLHAAIEQLQLARAAGDGDFYQLSVVDARLRELKVQLAEEAKAAKQP